MMHKNLPYVKTFRRPKGFFINSFITVEKWYPKYCLSITCSKCSTDQNLSSSLLCWSYLQGASQVNLPEKEKVSGWIDRSLEKKYCQLIILFNVNNMVVKENRVLSSEKRNFFLGLFSSCKYLYCKFNESKILCWSVQSLNRALIKYIYPGLVVP